MEFESDAFVLSARSHGETGAIVDLLTENKGRWMAHVAGGASRRMKPFLQAGARVIVQYRARTDYFRPSTLFRGVANTLAVMPLSQKHTIVSASLKRTTMWI